MCKIKKITEAQLGKIPEYVGKWKSIGLSTATPPNLKHFRSEPGEES